MTACVMMVMYEIYWVRYFRSEKSMRDFYSSLLGVPVAGATLPVLVFLCHRKEANDELQAEETAADERCLAGLCKGEDEKCFTE